MNGTIKVEFTQAGATQKRGYKSPEDLQNLFDLLKTSINNDFPFYVEIKYE